MKTYRKEARYVSLMVVHVPDLYPLVEMMRYERCCPAEEEEAQKILMIARHDPKTKPRDHLIRLIRYGATPDLSDRWRSFCATVIWQGDPNLGWPSEQRVDFLARSKGLPL